MIMDNILPDLIPFIDNESDIYEELPIREEISYDE